MLRVKFQIGADAFVFEGDVRLNDPHLLYLLRVWLATRAAAAPGDQQVKLDALALQLDTQADRLQRAVDAATLPPSATGDAPP